MASAIDPRASLQNVLSGLFDRPVQMAAAPKFEPAFAKAAVIAVYAGPDDAACGLLVCSISAAAYLGAALSLMPKPVAEDCIKKGALDAGLLENFREVANICSSLFAEQVGHRVQLKEVVNKVTAPPAALKPLMSSTNRADVSLEVPNYGGGIISVRLPK